MLLKHLFFVFQWLAFLSKKLSLQIIHAIDGMKLLIILLIFVLSGLPSSLCAEEVIVDSLYWQNAEQKMGEGEYEDAAHLYSIPLMNWNCKIVYSKSVYYSFLL